MAHFEAVKTFMRGAPHPHPRTDAKHRITHIAINEVNIYWRPESTSTVSTSQRRDLSRPQQAFNQGQHRTANEPENRLPENSQRVTEASGRKTFLQRFEELSNRARMAIHQRVATHPHINFMPFDYYVHDEVEFILEEEGVITAEPKDNSIREGLITANHPNRHNATVARSWAPKNPPTTADSTIHEYNLLDAATGRISRTYRIGRQTATIDALPSEAAIKASIEAGQPREANAVSYLSINWAEGYLSRLLRRARRRVRFLRKGQRLPSFTIDSDFIRTTHRKPWPHVKPSTNNRRRRLRNNAMLMAFTVAASAAA